MEGWPRFADGVVLGLRVDYSTLLGKEGSYLAGLVCLTPKIGTMPSLRNDEDRLPNFQRLVYGGATPCRAVVRSLHRFSVFVIAIAAAVMARRLNVHHLCITLAQIHLFLPDIHASLVPDKKKAAQEPLFFHFFVFQLTQTRNRTGPDESTCQSLYRCGRDMLRSRREPRFPCS